MCGPYWIWWLEGDIVVIRKKASSQGKFNTFMDTVDDNYLEMIERWIFYFDRLHFVSNGKRIVNFGFRRNIWIFLEIKNKSLSWPPWRWAQWSLETLVFFKFLYYNFFFNSLWFYFMTAVPNIFLIVFLENFINLKLDVSQNSQESIRFFLETILNRKKNTIMISRKQRSRLLRILYKNSPSTLARAIW